MRSRRRGLSVLVTSFVLMLGLVVPGVDVQAQDTWRASVGVHETAEGEVTSDFGTVRGTAEGNAEASVNVSDDGVQAEAALSLSAELEAISENLSVGDENAGASANVSAKVEALIGAEGSIGAYVDENGITIGGEVTAGAFVSAEVALNFEVHLFGVQANVKVYAEGHVGILAHGEAIVTIGFDGKIKFQLGAGVSIGIGASVGFEFDIDASALMDELGLADMAALLEWIDAFVEDPQSQIDQLIGDATDAAVDAGISVVADVVEDAVDGLIDLAEDSYDAIEDTFNNTYTAIADWLGWGSTDETGSDAEQVPSPSQSTDDEDDTLLPPATPSEDSDVWQTEPWSAGGDAGVR